MWQAFKDDIENCEPFKSREDYENWVRGWVEDSINECGRIERYYLGVEDPTDGLDIVIEDKNERKAEEAEKKTNCIYEIEYRYSDEDEFHNAYVLIYETGTVLGDTIQHAMDCADEDGDWAGLDKLLYDHYGLSDGDICFYVDVTVADEGDAKKDLEQSFDIIVKDMWVDRESKYEK